MAWRRLLTAPRLRISAMDERAIAGASLKFAGRAIYGIDL